MVVVGWGLVGVGGGGRRRGVEEERGGVDTTFIDHKPGDRWP